VEEAEEKGEYGWRVASPRLCSATTATCRSISRLTCRLSMSGMLLAVGHRDDRLCNISMPACVQTGKPQRSKGSAATAPSLTLDDSSSNRLLVRVLRPRFSPCLLVQVLCRQAGSVAMLTSRCSAYVPHVTSARPHFFCAQVPTCLSSPQYAWRQSHLWLCIAATWHRFRG